MKFDLGHLTFFSLSPFSLCRIYPWGRSFQTKLLKRYFLVFLLSVEALMKFDLGRFNFSFFSLCNLPLEKVILHKKHKKFFLVFLLSVEALLGANPTHLTIKGEGWGEGGIMVPCSQYTHKNTHLNI